MRSAACGPPGAVWARRESAPNPEPDGTHALAAGRGGPGEVGWGRWGAGPPREELRPGLLPPLIGPSHCRFYRQRFKSEDAPKIHVALSMTLFLLNLAFFFNVGHSPEQSDATCRTWGAVFHYFLLCTFTWMGLEAFHLYLLVIKVFNTYLGHYFLKLSFVGWGRCSSGGRGAWLAAGGAGGARGELPRPRGVSLSHTGSGLEGRAAGGDFGGGHAKGAPAMP